MTSIRRNAIDLHCHTTCSDGVLTAAELYAAARRFGLRLLAITDHDTLGAYRELRERGMGASASSFGPRLLPGVEINSVAEGIPDLWEGELHILGYGVDSDDEAFESVLAAQRARRRERLRATLDRLAAVKMPIESHLYSIVVGDACSVGRPHLARALVRGGYAMSVDDAFERLLGRGKPGYLPRVGLGPQAAIQAITGAGGVAVLAHFAAALQRPEVLDMLQGWGLSGLEVHYARRTFDPETVRALACLAAERGLLATGGSDYHGDAMPYEEAQAATFVPDEVEVPLLDAIAQARARVGRPTLS